MTNSFPYTQIRIARQRTTNEIAARLFNMGYLEVEPENPYWKKHGITIEYPDKWRIVLMEVNSFNVKV